MHLTKRSVICFLFTFPKFVPWFASFTLVDSVLFFLSASTLSDACFLMFCLFVAVAVVVVACVRVYVCGLIVFVFIQNTDLRYVDNNNIQFARTTAFFNDSFLFQCTDEENACVVLIKVVLRMRSFCSIQNESNIKPGIYVYLKYSQKLVTRFSSSNPLPKYSAVLSECRFQLQNMPFHKFIDMKKKLSSMQNESS